MAGIGSSSISFKGLKAAYVAGGDTSASGNSSLNDNKINTAISLSFFRSALLTDGSVIPASGQISINTNFKGKTFGESSNTYTTGDFNFNKNFSGESDRLYPVSPDSLTSSTTSSKIARLFHSNVSYNYPSILMCPQSGNPEIGLKDSAEVCIKIELNAPRHFQVGIVHKQGQSSWTNVASNCLRNRHATYNDRIALHTFGFITHAGHDVEAKGFKDELMGISFDSYRTTTSNYHNIIGTTVGSGNGFTTVSSSYRYLKTNVSFYKNKTFISSDYYLVLKLNYYEITLNGTVSSSSDSNKIKNVTLDGNKLTDSNDVYTGMYLSSDESGFPDCVIQSIDYSSSTTIDMGDELDGSTNNNFTGSSGTITFKASGQRFEFQYKSGPTVAPINIGPKHIILPRKFKTSSSSNTSDIDSWAFFVGDSTTGSNTATFTIQDDN